MIAHTGTLHKLPLLTLSFSGSYILDLVSDNKYSFGADILLE